MSYSSDASDHVALLDCFFPPDASQVLDINVTDPDVIFSDHSPVMLTVCIQHKPAVLLIRTSLTANATFINSPRYAGTMQTYYLIITTLDSGLSPCSRGQRFCMIIGMSYLSRRLPLPSRVYIEKWCLCCMTPQPHSSP
jgi:hypothetical protein